MKQNATKQTIGFTLSIFLAVLLLAVLYSAPAAGQTKLDGKAIFLAQKCNLCHSVESAGIARTTKSEKMAGPELTDLAAKQDAELLGKYLRKTADLKGKKHGKQFTGSDEELGALLAWLQQQQKKK